MTTRRVVQGQQLQGVAEKIAYTLTTTPWGGTPANVVVAAFDITRADQYETVTATVFPTGSASVSGDVITLPLLQALTRRHLYRVEVLWTNSGNTFEAYFEVLAER